MQGEGALPRTAGRLHLPAQGKQAAGFQGQSRLRTLAEQRVVRELGEALTQKAWEDYLASDSSLLGSLFTSLHVKTLAGPKHSVRCRQSLRGGGLPEPSHCKLMAPGCGLKAHQEEGPAPLPPRVPPAVCSHTPLPS